MKNVKVSGIKLEELDTDDIPLTPSKAPASFNGRLNLRSYAFSPPAKIKSEPTIESPTPQRPRPSWSKPYQPPTPVRSPLKRSASSQNLSPLKRSASATPPPTTPVKKKQKKPKKANGYAPPSTYAHLNELTDILAPNLILLFIGLNPGIMTATRGHAYSHGSNRFWPLLHSSGITTRRLHPSEDTTLPRDWQCGNTNIVARPTRNQMELSEGEMDGSVGVLAGKVAKWRPEAVCVVGKSIWESMFRVMKGRKLKKEEFRYGWQEGERFGVEEDAVDEEDGCLIKGWEGAKVFVSCSTSGLAASVPQAEKERMWRELGIWVEARRAERGIFAGVKSEDAEPPLKVEDQ